MKLLLTFFFIMFSFEAIADEITDYCLKKHGYDQSQFNTFNWSSASYCMEKIRTEKREAELKVLREFLRKNPRYKFPGQSWNKCFGMARENAITHVEHTRDKVVVYYKKYIETCLDLNK